MSYFKVLGLEKEPFSTSPDPSLFYLSKEHRAALYRLRISVKLRRGLSLILGDVGAGKTTLSRRFIQLLKDEPKVTAHMMLNPIFTDEGDFLSEICLRFGLATRPGEKTSVYFNELENHLFRKNINEGQTVVLLIDEAQKLNEACLEVLRGLLNYETNEYKLLQLVLVSQNEIVPRLRGMRNFWDRVSLKHMLAPLDYAEMRQMIGYRLSRVGYRSPVRIFTEEAMAAIWRTTGGFPRQVTQLCHDCLEHLVMHNLSYVDQALVDRLVARDNDFVSRTQPFRENADGTQTRTEPFNARRAAV